MRWQKEKDPLSPGRKAEEKNAPSPLSLFGLLAVLLTVVSFFVWNGDTGTGDVSRAVSLFEDFFSENEAVAVFLGWEGE